MYTEARQSMSANHHPKSPSTLQITTVAPLDGPVLGELEPHLLELTRIIAQVLHAEGRLSVLRPEWLGEPVGITLPKWKQT